MKVKVLNSFPVRETLESTLQEWLNDKPNANIDHVVQTPLTDAYGFVNSLLVTIFYRE